MPIYEYQCDACEHYLDVLQKVSDEPLVHCPACHEPTLKKLVSAPSFRLKGSGWYETDFKKDKRRNLADSGEKSADKADGKEKQKPDKGAADKTATDGESAKSAKSSATTGSSTGTD